MARRLRDALALNVGAAVGFHLLTLACRYVEAKRQMGRDGLTVAHIASLFSEAS
jgi:hypothetical protein